MLDCYTFQFKQMETTQGYKLTPQTKLDYFNSVQHKT